MDSNKMSEKITSLKVEDIFNSKTVKYKIPIYQRNYAWKEPQIRQLIRDIYDYCGEKNKEKKYYIGTLVVRPDKEKNTFEVIDGQQRLTTLSMLVAYLNSIVKGQDNTQESVKSELKNTITFQCRQVSTNSLNKIWGKNSSDDYEATDPILAGYQILKKSFEDIVGKASGNVTNEDYLKYLLENVIIYRIPVPEDTDLNHYFEIMNTRGEQLEKHEILKAKLLSVFKYNTGTIEFYSGIWDACSDMGKYVCPEALLQRSQDKKQDSNDQGNKGENSHKQDFTIESIIENTDGKPGNNNGQNNSQEDNSAEDRYRSIIDFPNFLLLVLKLMDKETDLDDKKLLEQLTVLDDKKLLEQFNEKILNEETKKDKVEEFFGILLKARYLFDCYVIKRDLSSGKWILKSLSIEENKKEKTLKNTFDDDSKNKQILMLLSMFEVSFPNYSYKSWLFETLKYLTGNAQNCESGYKIFSTNFKEDCLPTWNMVDADDYIDHLEQYANKKRCEYGEFVCPVNVDNLNKFDKMACSIEEQRCGTVNLENFDAFDKGTAVPNFIFNLLDYKLWKNEKGKYKDFEFTYRDSVEHFYPQNPIGGKPVENVDSFGNLCLITSEMNSRLNNLLPSAKRDIWKASKSQPSIKLSKMMEMMETKEWDEEAIEDHKTKMLEVLFDKETSEH